MKVKKLSNKKTVFVSGVFNVVHPGHLRLLRFAKECGDHLVIGVLSDNMADNAHVLESLRLENVLSNNWVDEALIIDEPPSDFISRLQPDVVVKGKEHQSKFNLEEEVLKSYGGKLLFGSGEIVFSSLDLLSKNFSELNTRLNVPNEYLSRHNIKIEEIIKILQSFKEIEVCVVGDLIIDEYVTCEALGMSQEEPTIAVTPIDSSVFLGGAGIVAAHASGLGAHATLLSLRGNDAKGELAEELLKEKGVNSNFVIDENRLTTFKQRFRSKGKSLLKVNHLHQAAMSRSLQQQLLENLKPIIQKIDLLVFSDFNYGCLPQELVDQIVSIAKLNKVMLTADSQSSSQVGDISRFKGMDMKTPTEREARISSKNHEDGLVVLAENLRKQSQAKSVLIKLGEEGLFINTSNSKESDVTDRINALNNAAKDVAGAGDSLLITASLALSRGASIWEASYLGSLAAAIQVGREGNIPLEIKELLSKLS